MESQKKSDNEGNPEKEQSGRQYIPWFQTTLQSCSNKRVMALAQKQTHRPMKESKDPQIKRPGKLNAWSTTTEQEFQEHPVGKG